MKKIKKLRLLEEIGFNYNKSDEVKKEPIEEIEEVTPISLDPLAKTIMNISRAAFNAGRNNKMSFDDWWNKSLGGSIQQKKAVVAKNPVGFKFKPAETAETAETKDSIENKPRRIGPKITPGKPGKPGRPTYPSKPSRKGIWFEDPK